MGSFLVWSAYSVRYTSPSPLFPHTRYPYLYDLCLMNDTSPSPLARRALIRRCLGASFHYFNGLIAIITLGCCMNSHGSKRKKTESTLSSCSQTAFFFMTSVRNHILFCTFLLACFLLCCTYFPNPARSSQNQSRRHMQVFLWIYLFTITA
jgi:hypothetical protein